MKKNIFVFLVLFVVTTTTFSQQQVLGNLEIVENEIVLNWVSSYNEVLKKSKKENKPVLIYFTGSDWCGPCISLDRKLFHTEKFKSYADENLILYMADSPRNLDLVDAETRKVNDRLSKKYKQKAFPTLVMVNHKGKLLGAKKGVYMTEYYFPFFKSVVDKY